MRVVYVAGPYRDDGANGVWENIMRARAAARECWKRGWAAICPHASSIFMDGPDMPDRTFLDGDLEILRRSDAVLMIDGWERSEGARGEYALAVEMGKDVYFGEVPYAN